MLLMRFIVVYTHSCGIDRGEAVGSSWKTTSDSCCEKTVCVLGCVQPPLRNKYQSVMYIILKTSHLLEELEHRRIKWSGLREAREFLDNDVGMSNNQPLRVYLLWSTIIVLYSIDEVPRLHIENFHCNIEGRVLHDACVKVRGRDKLAGRHHGSGWDSSHDDRVARPLLNLQTVRQWEILVNTEVDEVVLGRKRWNLARCSHTQSVKYEWK